MSAGLPPGHDLDARGSGPPAIVLFFRLYMGLITLTSLGTTIGLGVVFYNERPTSKDDALGQALVWAIFGSITTIMAALHAVGLVCPRRPWMYTFGAVVLGFSTLSCASLPFAVALLIFWLKPEVKRWLETG